MWTAAPTCELQPLMSTHPLLPDASENPPVAELNVKVSVAAPVHALNDKYSCCVPGGDGDGDGDGGCDPGHPPNIMAWN